ncbi:hypothetical protein RclHR1_05220001 [Rhizophagus clarus]|uniref:CCHC-type domain-containing protein n=1 Tax=Rhizophagus clarus TaxID=94130 RepID=A0A2Z6RMF1_9GLOM|nr:hypothetical protein RclHR1_05220001 [Rhizophagus clarus]GES79153.1 hypothetical protein GLOIN_2v1482196 [Rhizophagus clarus]
MSDNNWETVKPKKAFKRFNQNSNERKSLKKTKYGTGCLYCHKEGHWQWECPEIRCKNCGELGHKMCKGKFQQDKPQLHKPQRVIANQEELQSHKPQRVIVNQEEPRLHKPQRVIVNQEEPQLHKSQRVIVNQEVTQGPSFRNDKQQKRSPTKEMKICQECGRRETAWVSVNEKHYIIINNEYLAPEDDNIEQKYGPLCLKCEEKFQRRISKSKGEYQPIECNQCGKKGSKNNMEQLQEGYEPKYYCDLNCLYARKILMEGKINKERLEILLNRYTEGSKYKGSQSKDVTKKEIIKRMKGSVIFKESEEHKQQQQFYESWKKAIKTNEFGKDFPTYFKEVILQDPEVKELIGLRPEGILALEKSIEFKNKQLKEYNYLQAKYGNLTEFIEMQIRNNRQQQNRIQQLENEITALKDFKKF